MAIINRISAFSDDMKTWRRHFHQNPELGLACHKTAAFVVERLREFGITEIHEGIATSGVVAIIEGKENGPTIGLRADMDALPMTETTGVEYASQNDGLMHACGHDGHTATLLGAAKYLAETRNFSGRVALIFQPAEENEGGGRIMVEEGIMDRFDIKQVYAIHNVPNISLGEFHTVPGPILASADEFTVEITGLGGHAASPHEARDPVVAAMAIAQAFYTITTRNNDPFDKLVISISQIHAGTADNVIPETAFINGTVRTFDKKVQKMVIERMEQIVAGHSTSYNVDAQLQYHVGYPPTINTAQNAEFAAEVAREIVGPQNVNGNSKADMGAEDFSYMLEARPGAFLYLGIGENASLHNTHYNYNDEASVFGASFFARLVERAQPLAAK